MFPYEEYTLTYNFDVEIVYAYSNFLTLGGLIAAFDTVFRLAWQKKAIRFGDGWCYTVSFLSELFDFLDRQFGEFGNLLNGNAVLFHFTSNSD